MVAVAVVGLLACGGGGSGGGGSAGGVKVTLPDCVRLHVRVSRQSCSGAPALSYLAWRSISWPGAQRPRLALSQLAWHLVNWDSAFCQVFSLCYGTVHEEVNHLKRSQGPSKHKEGNLVTKISEDGVTFRSYRCGWVVGG